MATGASNSDVAIILIDASKGILDQTKRHTFILSLLGIENIIVTVNKMDLIDFNQNKFEGVDFICANTDTQALSSADGAITLKLGNGLTKGLGAGADPEIGKRAAESDRAAIEELLFGADMIFITAGMGGGTGTEADPVIDSIAKEIGN